MCLISIQINLFFFIERYFFKRMYIQLNYMYIILPNKKKTFKNMNNIINDYYLFSKNSLESCLANLTLPTSSTALTRASQLQSFEFLNQ